VALAALEAAAAAVAALMEHPLLQEQAAMAALVLY
jgi:hypothetical protein